MNNKGQTLGSLLTMFFFYFLFAILIIVFFVIMTPDPSQANENIKTELSEIESQKILLGLLRQPYSSSTISYGIIGAVLKNDFSAINDKIKSSLDSVIKNKDCDGECSWKLSVYKGSTLVNMIQSKDNDDLVEYAKASLPENIIIDLMIYKVPDE